MLKKVMKKSIKKSLMKVMVTMSPLLLLLVIVSVTALIIIGSNGNTNENSGVSMGTASVSAEVLAWKPLVEKYANQFEISEYVNLMLALIQQESVGTEIDVMQSSEGAFNTRYPKMPNGITDPDYSIFCGVQEFKEAITKADVKDINDTKNISLALQTYNFGEGFIQFAKLKGGYSLEVAQEFSNIQAQKYGWSSYGDVDYVTHVFQYYKSTNTDIKGGSGKLEKVIEIAQKQQGKAYIWGASGPDTFDCSGLIFYCYQNAGYKIERTTAQGYFDKSTRTTTPEIGDLVFFGTVSDVHHIGMYIGNGKMINAPKSNDIVKIQSYERPDLMGFGKYN
ncbi:bifunctional lysozyme/C40 family peptidase [Clostridium sp. CF011]|uniref:bifunctional lytic transglycosylase/C40 family peptidase n=1 Tax=Clostridium sp. CF011 TaxID=2843318 RepID=UPI001C0D0FC6|nr:bifunctional lytic transglycosylase/C40 family peptidase [Clostridium sp. CF011]MBU3093856.1 bifunctional lysozyme/C40 family peptidase [Clostridium sp. CF011]WAG71711.1 bifunctional lysozyme/C40 family peptidase [Clostridium sp. CF011]